MPDYSLDANVFIEAKKRYYAFDLCPGFWKALVWQHGQGTIGSIDRVFEELKDQGDELTDWVSTEMPQTCFSSTDQEDVIEGYAKVAAWVNGEERFTQAAKAQFLNTADGWLVAYGAARGTVIVTHEQSAPDSRKVVKIPDACLAFNVHFVNTFEMLRTLATEFNWTQSP